MEMDKVNELIEEVKSLGQEELTELTHAIRDRRDRLRAKDLEGFRVGDKVSWTKGSGTTKETFNGKVEKVNLKTVGVKEDGRPWIHWRCPPSLLTKLGENE